MGSNAPTESELWERYRRTLDPADRRAIADLHVGLVLTVAGVYAPRLVGRHVDEGDLIGAGTFGLLDAIDNYQPSRGVRFRTFARTHIWGAMVDYVRNVNATRHHATAELRRRTVSLDTVTPGKVFECGQARDTTGAGRTADPKATDPAIVAALRDEAAAALRGLSARDARILRLYYGDEMNDREIAPHVGLSQSGVTMARKAAFGRVAPNTLRPSFCRKSRRPQQPKPQEAAA